jgi:hypothetical protein
VFADWNANGQPDSGEGTIAGIPVALGLLAHVTTSGDGAFAFLNVPTGAQRVSIDLTALPVDFDPPAAADVTVEIGRGDTRRVAFGLIPLGTIYGRVIEDARELASPRIWWNHPRGICLIACALVSSQPGGPRT